MKRYLILFLISCWPIAGLTSTTVQVDSQTVQVNDVFHLVISSDDARTGGMPNLKPLQTDFTIMGTEHSQSYNIVNGQASSSNQWIILLRPKKTGQLTIPALNVGHEQTRPVSIEVTDEAKPRASLDHDESTGNEDVLLKTEVNEQQPYVNQQVLYTVKLYTNKQLLNAEYQPPKADNALLVPMGDGRHYQTQLNDQTYAVEEQQYAIFPQKSGALTITPPSFRATIYDNFPRQVTTNTKDTTLSVRPAPTDFQGENWLPAEKITLTETYDPASDEMNEGDTLTRTVQLQAVAMPAQLLPTLHFKENKTFNVYPESPEVTNAVQNNALIGTSTIKATYLLNHAGSVTIPKLEIPWFNTLTGKTEISILPARTLTIGAKGTTTPKLNQRTEESSTSPKVTPKAKIETPQPQNHPYNSLWAFIAGLVLACGVITLLSKIRHSNRFRQSQENQSAIKHLRTACQNNNPNMARMALIDWAKTQWPEAQILNLQDIAKYTRDTGLKKQLLALTEALYQSKPSTPWRGEGLWKSFSAFLKTKSNHSPTRSYLPPINPN